MGSTGSRQVEKNGFLFTGQGAQRAGMGADLFERSAAARELWNRANDVVGFDLAGTCFRGSDEEVNRTDICQPGIFVTSLAALAAYREAGGHADRTCSFAAGLSLGEYAALTFAGAIDFDEALALVRLRGQAMQEACDAEPGGMLSLIGAGVEQAWALCEAVAEDGHLTVANVLAPKLVVVSGAMAAVDAAQKAAKEHGVRAARKLVVAGAFHSKLMQPAAEKLTRKLRDVEIFASKIPVVSNVTGLPVRDPEQIRDNLGRQVVSPVLWADSMACMAGQGVRTFFEFGPGTVLTGLLKKNGDGLSGVNVNTMESVQAVLAGAAK